MEPATQDDAHSIVSGLTSLESEADDFERLMIQKERDDHRLKTGQAQPFRKARTHPRVGLTIDNLERNNARNEAAQGANARASSGGGSPPSSSGSMRSDPAIHAPAGWGRKGKTNMKWMRTITYEEEREQHTPVPADEDAAYANAPRHSIEDSPLSRKSAYGTPRHGEDADWDFTFDLNEASILASTPYIPRNTALDDIRQREMESLREQGVAKAQMDTTRDGEAESPSARSGKGVSKSMANSVASLPDHATGSPQKRPRTRTDSWQALSRSQPTLGTTTAHSPIAVHKKSAETIGVVERDVAVSAQRVPPRRAGTRREDSQDLLRRLARVSNTPSPARVEAARPKTAHGRQQSSSSQTMVNDAPSPSPEVKEEVVEDAPAPPPAAAERPASQYDQPPPETQKPENTPQSAPETPAEEPDPTPTPAPVERSILNPKTPIVTGAWVDTPGPRTALRTTNPPQTRSRSQSPPQTSPRKSKSPTKRSASLPGITPLEPKRPHLPSSALDALIQSARHDSADYGDSTINSLQDLMCPGDEVDEDTLQGLKLPTEIPKNEAERQRQQELTHLHRMNERLRAARTSIRDASRGMKRLDDQVEGAEEGDMGRKVGVVHAECPCAADNAHMSVWRSCRSWVWDERLKVSRKGTQWRRIGGLTGLGLLLMMAALWWVGEEIACEIHCHPQFATSSPYPFSVNMHAPRYPFVLPTLFYRALVRPWWLPLSALLSPFAAQLSLAHGMGHVQDSPHAHALTHTRAWALESQATAVVDVDVDEEMVWGARMVDDEVLRERGR
ncbi:hypothetical protein P153DRAFT_381964 [Dothidotthia symphoricarpi CBS 119687]|uniref:Uncharacterized protein n=1 Tax=Dothidotthia symphoricarpi CBS 119687 TaxID=1392245 RepID=A0A6A6ARC4_9PLEO|nr:uncharacterized protein P153DRAFT_381964 [Dothidotthia symphoricarpi CBS 119687]KAF2133535.1 hypothetical protein P153DRAFT_381964 [Dothidotthia symphoricarpi CBS 119687]